MANKMAVFDMCMSICVHVRSRFTAPSISGCEVLKQKQKIVFWHRFSCVARENQDRKKEKTSTRARARNGKRGVEVSSFFFLFLFSFSLFPISLSGAGARCSGIALVLVGWGLGFCFGFGVFPSPFFLRQAKPPCGVVPLKFWWGFDVSMKYEYEI